MIYKKMPYYASNRISPKLLPIVFGVFITLFSCTKKDPYLLSGKIGADTKASISVLVSDNKVSGELSYDQEKTVIKLTGQIINNIMTLYEYNKKNNINGIFVGEFDRKSYIGTWTDSKGKSNAPFKFEIIKPSNPLKKESTPVSTKNLDKKHIKEAYGNWVQKKINSGKFWSEKKWTKAFEKYRSGNVDFDKFIDTCIDGLPDSMTTVHYGDINGDDILDAWAYIIPMYCMEGTWQIGVRHIPLFIISKSNGEYSVIPEPKVFDSGTFGGVDTILPSGIIIYEGRDYQGSDARCCPSKTWKSKYKYEGGSFRKIK